MKKHDLSEPDAIISDAKKIMKKKLISFFFFGEIGLFIIIYTDKSTETFDNFELKRDFTSLKTGIIVQGLCVISSQNVKPVLNSMLLILKLKLLVTASVLQK